MPRPHIRLHFLTSGAWGADLHIERGQPPIAITRPTPTAYAAMREALALWRDWLGISNYA